MSRQPKLDRRRFLLGSGGATLILPVLPSLFTPTEVAAQVRSQKCFIQFVTPHGSVRQRNMYPAQATGTSLRTESPAGFQVRSSPLVPTQSGGQTRLSEVLRASSGVFTQAMVNRMNVLNGLDIPFYVGHHEAGHLGNFASSNEGEASNPNGFRVPQGRRVTIDQVMAFSPTFDPNPPAIRSIYVGNRVGDRFNEPASWEYQNPDARTGVQPNDPTANTNQALFDRLFPNTGTQPPQAPQRLLVDTVLQDYNRQRQNPRLSTEDKRRLDDHMSRLAELQRRLQSQQPGTPPARPTRPGESNAGLGGRLTAADQNRNQQLWNDVVVAAMSVGACRIFVNLLNDEFAAHTGNGSWHEDLIHSEVARGISAAERAPLTATVNGVARRFFESVFLDFATKLDAVPAVGGGSMLDHSLLAWAQEAGNYTHNETSMPIVTLGSANGFFRTGQYCDYRNLNKEIRNGDNVDNESRWHGTLLHQWLGTILQSMGLPRSEYELPGRENDGYPSFRYDDIASFARYSGREAPYPDAVWNQTGNVLPFLKA